MDEKSTCYILWNMNWRIVSSLKCAISGFKIYYIVRVCFLNITTHFSAFILLLSKKKTKYDYKVHVYFFYILHRNINSKIHLIFELYSPKQKIILLLA